MKKLLAVILAISLSFSFAPLGTAGNFETEITPNGLNQGALVNTLKVMQTLVNELAADHDADNATVTEIALDHDADNTIVATYETLLEELGTDHDADNDVTADLKTLSNDLQDRDVESIVQIGTLTISATAEKYKTTTTMFAVINGFSITKTATDNLTFTAADTVNTGAAAGTLWGAWKIEIGLDGTMYTNSVSSDQVYADEATAVAALPATTALRAYVGYITVNANDTASWTANTDDMTDASDCVTTDFYDTAAVSAATAVSSTVAADLAATFVLGTVAGNLAASSFAADLSADSTLGSGTALDPSISLTD